MYSDLLGIVLAVAADDDCQICALTHRRTRWAGIHDGADSVKRSQADGL